MKKYCLFLLSLIIFFSCDENSDIVEPNNNIEKIELSNSELLLKTQMADAAEIIAQIVSKDVVISELVDSINSQPKIIEDRVKFAKMFKISEVGLTKEKSTSSVTFASEFKKILSNTNLKSASTIIDDLIKQGVEINIPFPIEDYPEGTNIVVTSHPLDNYYENIGYVVGTGEKVMVNDELTLTNPVIIVWPSTVSDEEVNEYLTTKRTVEKSNESLLKSLTSTLPPTTILPLTHWDDEDYAHRVKITHLYVKNDHRSGVFRKNSKIYFGAASLNYDSSTKIVVNTTGEGNAVPNYFSISLPPKYEKWAKKGYSKGWYDCGNQVLFEDWQPAIKYSTFAGWVDVAGSSSEITIDFAALAKIAISLVAPEAAILSNLSGSSPIKYTYKETANDVVYAQRTKYRYSYKNDYNSAGTKWGEVGEKTFPVDEYGYRPALQLSPDLLYITTYDAYEIE